jgi:hypothetical protein
MTVNVAGSSACRRVVPGKWRLEKKLGISVASETVSKVHQASSGLQLRRQVMEGVMAKVIEFYVSDSLPKKSNYIACKERGKLIEFRAPKRNQANSNSAQWPGMCMAYIAPFAANYECGRTGDTI